MGNPAGVRRDFDALEKRRFAAIRLLEDGLPQTEIAHRLNVCRSTVVRWIAHYRHDGKDALRKAARAGRRSMLSRKDRQRLEQLLLRGPEAVGYETPLWTCPPVARLITAFWNQASLWPE
jgi:transposase